MIEVAGLKKCFGTHVVVDNISFTVNKGEVLGFLGPNGAGKSTTMKMITGFLTPTEGTANVCGHDILSDPLKVKEAIGYLPEGAPAYGDMTAHEFLGFIADIRGYTGLEKQQRVTQAVEQVNLEAVLHQPIETLSKGFKRRVGLAQAILHDPPVLIMDEPTDGLDPNQKHEVRQLIHTMAKEKAIIVSTHILEEVHAVCTRAIIIAEGKLLFDGTPDALSRQSKYYNAVSLNMATDDPNSIKEKLHALPSVKAVEQSALENGESHFVVYPQDGKPIIKEVGHLVHTSGWEVDELSVESRHLDEVFRSITTPSTVPAEGAQ